MDSRVEEDAVQGVSEGRDRDVVRRRVRDKGGRGGREDMLIRRKFARRRVVRLFAPCERGVISIGICPAGLRQIAIEEIARPRGRCSLPVLGVARPAIPRGVLPFVLL